MNIPDELSLISLFGCEPKLLDDNLPYRYNEATYDFFNASDERFVVSISPSYSEITIQVYPTNSSEMNTFLQFKNAEDIEILIDNKEEAVMQIKADECLTRINFKPRFNISLVYSD